MQDRAGLTPAKLPQEIQTIEPTATAVSDPILNRTSKQVSWLAPMQHIADGRLMSAFGDSPTV
jgi:hypothetical protein